MQLKEFTNRNNLKLSEAEQLLCLEGIKRMRSGRGSVKSDNHISELLESLDYFLNEGAIDKGKLKLNVLLLSICWHDIWKAGKVPRNIMQLFWNTVWDGMGSFLIFSEKAKASNVPINTIRKARYCIRKHSFLQVMPVKSYEAKVLRDLDKISVWTDSKLYVWKNRFFRKEKPNLAKLWMAKISFKLFIKPSISWRCHLPSLEQELKIRRSKMIKKIKRVLIEYEDLVTGL